MKSIDINKLDRLSDDCLQQLFADDLFDLSNNNADASYEAEWKEESEQKIWALPCFLLEVGRRVIMWSKTDEAGVADVTVSEINDEYSDMVKDFSEEIASGLGGLQK